METVNITPSQLRAIMPSSGARADVYAPLLSSYSDQYGIDSQRRMAPFLGQLAVESGELKYTREIWGPTRLQLTYEGRKDLGNTEPGDGIKFLGRGLIQISGRSNYAMLGAAIGVDLISHPELLEQPDAAAQSACWYWAEHDLNADADANDYVAITRGINGGLSHYDLRCVYLDRALNVFGALQ